MLFPLEKTTDKRTDVWSRDFMIWKINFGPWAVAWAGLWNKRVWADYEQLFSSVFSIFHGHFLNFFDPGKVKKGPEKLLIIDPDPFFPQSSPGHSPQAKIDFPY